MIIENRIINAYFSDDRRYRYWLTRKWDDYLPSMCVIGLNPSTADESIDDPTIRKCKGFATRLGFGSLLMLNVMAYRATKPKECLSQSDPFGPLNTVDHLASYITYGVGSLPIPMLVVAAWGRNCAKYRPMVRALEISAAIPYLWCWGRNKDRTPRHPLMLPYITQMEIFNT